MTAMTISDTERREVARRLRYDAKGGALPYSDFFGAVAYDVGVEKEHTAVLNRLADLIEPSEPKVKCVAEVKVDGERLEQLVHDAAVELTGIDRDALLALADEMKEKVLVYDRLGLRVPTRDVMGYADRIREALGASE